MSCKSNRDQLVSRRKSTCARIKPVMYTAHKHTNAFTICFFYLTALQNTIFFLDIPWRTTTMYATGTLSRSAKRIPPFPNLVILPRVETDENKHAGHASHNEGIPSDNQPCKISSPLQKILHFPLQKMLCKITARPPRSAELLASTWWGSPTLFHPWTCSSSRCPRCSCLGQLASREARPELLVLQA